MSGQRRTGPGRLSPGEIPNIPRVASTGAPICIEDDTGRLQVGPAWIEQANEDEPP